MGSEEELSLSESWTVMWSDGGFRAADVEFDVKWRGSWLSPGSRSVDVRHSNHGGQQVFTNMPQMMAGLTAFYISEFIFLIWCDVTKAAVELILIHCC